MAYPLVLFLVALGARIVTGAAFIDPAYPDSFYYVNVAHQLAAGHGFSVDYIWNFVDVGGRLPDLAVLPIASNAHWMPLASLVQVPFIWLLGPTALASALPFWIIGALAAPLTFAIARDAGLSRFQAVAGGLLAAVPGAVSPYLSQPDNFGLFMTLAALSLWACSRGLKGDRRAFALGGLFVGLATLSRNDGVLLGVPFALAFLLDLRRRGIRRPSIGWRTALLCAGGFLLVTAAWWIRQLDVFGSLLPSGSSGRILWITDYRQLYSISGPSPSLSSFLAQGAGPILASRLGGLISAVVIFAGMPLLLFMAPLTVIGAWLRRRDPNFAPWLVYAVTLFAFSALLFAVHVPYGTFIHSAVGLLPHAYLAAILGIGAAVRWVATRRTRWDVQRATRVFTVAAVAGVMLGAVGGSVIVIGSWQSEHDLREQVMAALSGVPSDDRLMSADAGAYEYLGDRPGIVTPDDPLDVVESAMKAYDIRWLVLERDHIVASLVPILSGAERPAWLSAPKLVVNDDTPTGAGASVPTLPRAALYAVCFDPTDTRCAP